MYTEEIDPSDICGYCCESPCVCEYDDDDAEDDEEIDEDEDLTNNYLDKRLTDRLEYDHELSGEL